MSCRELSTSVTGCLSPTHPTTRYGSCGGSMLIIEIRAAEGGDDAKLLVREQVQIYAKLAARRGL